MRAGAAALLALLLAACSGGSDSSAEKGKVLPPLDLEKAAIERGLVRDPKDSDIAGLYARDTDRVCILHDGAGYRIGAHVDYGDRVTCSGSGKVSRVGNSLQIDLGGKGDCSFEAKFDGERLRFPATVPEGCEKFCARRASFAAMEVERLSESAAEAAAMRDTSGRLLCAEKH